LAPAANCDCGAFELIADHIITFYPAYDQYHKGMYGLASLDDKTKTWRCMTQLTHASIKLAPNEEDAFFNKLCNNVIILLDFE